MRKTSVIMVAATAALDRSKELASYSCNGCKNITSVQASMDQPFCAHCGDDGLVPTEHSSTKGRKLLRAPDAELSNVRCPSCSSHLIMTTATASAFADGKSVSKMHCVACNNPISFVSPESASTEDDDWAEEEEETEVNEDEELDDDASSSEESEEGVEPSDDDDEDESEDDEEPVSITVRDSNGEVLGKGQLVSRDDLIFVVDHELADDEIEERIFTIGSVDDLVEDDDGALTLNNAELVDAGEAEDDMDESEDDEEEAAVEQAGDESDDADKPDEEPEDKLDEDENLEEDAEKQDGEENATTDLVVGGDPIDVPLHQTIADKPEFASYGELTVCKQGGTITAHRVGPNQGLANALSMAVASGNSLAEVLDMNGFEVANVQITEAAHVANRINQVREEEAATASSQLADVGDRLGQSMGIALMGMNSGFFQQQNPLTEAVIAALKNHMGDEAAQEVVNEAAVQTAGEFATVIRDLTMTTYNRSEEVRNELAQLLAREVRAETASIRRQRPSVERQLENPLRSSTVASVDQREVSSLGQPKTRVQSLAKGQGLKFNR